jgi:hypothetical protein
MNNNLTLLLSCIISIALLHSCETEFYYRGGERDLVYLSSFIETDQDTNIFALFKAAGVKDELMGYDGKYLFKESFSIRVNGTEVHSFKNNGTSKSFNDNFYYTTYRFTPGDEIRIDVSAQDLPDAFAEVRIPEQFNPTNCQLSYDPDNTFIVSISDTPGTEDYYGVKLEVRILDSARSSPLVFLDDSGRDGKSLSVNLSSITKYILGPDENPYDFCYRIIIRKYTKDSYREAKRKQINYDDDMIHFGVTAPFLARWSNVEGGVGFVSVFSESRTEWICLQ